MNHLAERMHQISSEEEISKLELELKNLSSENNNFTYKTGKTSGTVGDLWDMSKELSDKRKSQNDNNVDPIKKENFKNYSKKRKGIKHPQDKSKG